jgi:hypothetical protein
MHMFFISGIYYCKLAEHKEGFFGKLLGKSDLNSYKMLRFHIINSESIDALKKYELIKNLAPSNVVLTIQKIYSTDSDKLVGDINFFHGFSSNANELINKEILSTYVFDEIESARTNRLVFVEPGTSKKISVSTENDGTLVHVVELGKFELYKFQPGNQVNSFDIKCYLKEKP